ncbi:bifunctional 4-hydroxy-2-oxoglutarate aldolase/2-dehydro-3-deoxy-phosphogluconate aldolase [Thermobifida halotolerans]|uniref:Bifunctional 4-hydroxy-2-oxoglutarate aldolase/2-dehydro-3-deoxy-phosphogluconate aldolase n=1 Tax=Thermobifida halotolerans TaxID=483545 RepID=A0A399G0Q6_9ACTN|nr:bifunctional 4-hydroxy-2-oxoglutarate aldolase/2-dehydro-3-deoxy-phosphogluconate aldolase [Thermobifida halotolerans]UOE19256.1 bifunctional 4-hydroxy-2-oxoglutarate aldolase/2-dehydro-3-deoxy-phosphogluconate aldolase [Thermobifida halotolerans]
MSVDLTELFSGQRIMAILRGMSEHTTVELANRAWDLGMDLVEVPIQSSAALPALRAAVAAGRERGRPVGAGTVTTPARVVQAAEAGAAFTVAPGFDGEVLAASLAAGMPHLPGVATPSEIQRALRHGVTWLKAFPASVLGPDWFTAMRGPFPEVNLVATGGVSAHDAADYLTAGARAVAVGSALADPSQWEKLTEIIGG